MEAAPESPHIGAASFSQFFFSRGKNGIRGISGKG
jgi:hypothetical protein